MTEQERLEQLFRRGDLALAVMRLANDWHSGGSSKGYKKLSQAARVLSRLGYDRYHWDVPEVRHFAAEYLWKHRREIRANW